MIAVKQEVAALHKGKLGRFSAERMSSLGNWRQVTVQYKICLEAERVCYRTHTEECTVTACRT